MLACNKDNQLLCPKIRGFELVDVLGFDWGYAWCMFALGAFSLTSLLFGWWFMVFFAKRGR